MFGRVRSLKKQRQDFEEFCSAFSNEKIPDSLLLSTYQYFQEWLHDFQFPIRAEDSIARVDGAVDEDLSDAILEIAKRAGCDTPTTKRVAHLEPVRTIADLVRLVALFHPDRNE
jgi:hypothetical protein